MWPVLLVALLPAAGNFLGGMIADTTRAPPRVLNWALHAAAGIIIAIVAVELVPAARGVLAGWWIALAFVAGGGAYIAVNSAVKRLQSSSAADERRRMWMIYAAIAVDLVSDGIMIGTGAAVSLQLAVVLAAGQVLADVPEGYAAMANFRDKGVPRKTRILLSASFFIFVLGATLVAYLLLRHAPDSWQAAGLVFAGALLLVAAVEDMLEEAHETREDTRGSVLAFVGGFALFVLVSAGLERALGQVG
nr:peptidoglycan-binding protein [Thioalkalivibrio sp. XN8]